MGSPKLFFAIVMILISGAGVWMGGVFLFNLYEYLLLSRSSPATTRGWAVKEVKPGRFAIHADFEFQVGEMTVSQHFRFSKPIYQNRHLALALVEVWEKTPWWAWYNPKHPEKASLQRQFPVKSGVYCVICLIIILYFSLLRVYVQRVSGIDLR